MFHSDDYRQSSFFCCFSGEIWRTSSSPHIISTDRSKRRTICSLPSETITINSKTVYLLSLCSGIRSDQKRAVEPSNCSIVATLLKRNTEKSDPRDNFSSLVLPSTRRSDRNIRDKFASYDLERETRETKERKIECELAPSSRYSFQLDRMAKKDIAQRFCNSALLDNQHVQCREIKRSKTIFSTVCTIRNKIQIEKTNYRR